MAIIQINADLAATNKILERLTRALERILLEAYDVKLGHCAEPAVDPNPSEKPSVGYHTDRDTLREEMMTLSGWKEHGAESEDETEEEDAFGV